MKRFAVLFLFATAFGAQCIAAEEGWIDLFNGKDLAGWVQHSGQAKYGVEDGAIVGTTVLGTGNSFLCTSKEYGDFVFECEFRVDPNLNSGIQFRSQVFDKETELKGKDGQPIVDKGKAKKVPADRVHGYQCEIDPSPRGFTAGVYDEARRGWLFPGPLGGEKEQFGEQGRRLILANDWNKVRIECRGPKITTYLNGEKRAEMTDDLTLRGLICLQVHGIGKDSQKEGIKVMWRNLRILVLDGL
jgi:hypothetical protein